MYENSNQFYTELVSSEMLRYLILDIGIHLSSEGYSKFFFSNLYSNQCKLQYACHHQIKKIQVTSINYRLLRYYLQNYTINNSNMQ